MEYAIDLVGRPSKKKEIFETNVLDLNSEGSRKKMFESKNRSKIFH